MGSGFNAKYAILLIQFDRLVLNWSVIVFSIAGDSEQ